MSEEIVIPPDVEANQTERELMEKYLDKKKTVDNLTDLLKQATHDRDEAEARLIKMLQDEGKQATARYEGLGHLIMVQGAAHASIQKGMQDDVKNHLRAIGRDDLIKESIAAAPLSAFVRECLASNAEIPSGITFYAPVYLKFYEAK